MMPWIHLHVTQYGTVTPCCQTPWEKEESFGSINEDSIETLWNGKKIRSFRRKLLKDERDQRCFRCYEKEENGWLSLRKITNSDYAHKLSLVNTTKRNGEVPEGKPVYLDIRFSNVCNLKCRICGPWSSSQWYKDAVELGMISRDTPALTKGIKDEAGFWRQIDELIPDLEEIYFAGGEPLMMEEHYLLLEKLHERRKFNLVLKYNTNLSELSFKDWDVVELWKPFHKVVISASLDGMEKRGEYQRKNQNWGQVEKNRVRLISNLENLRFLISPTVSIFSVLHLPDFHRNWVEKGLIDPEGMVPSLLQKPDLYNIRILPESIRSVAITKLERYLEWLGTFPVKDLSISTVISDQWNAVIRILKGEQEGDLVALRESILKLDKLRGEDFSDVFPELSELIE